MNRKDFQELAEVRLDEANALRDRGKWDGAYYLAGFSIECALKACLAKKTVEHEFPPDRKYVDKCYVHDLPALLNHAGLQAELKAEATRSSNIASNWATVQAWTIESRYRRTTENQACELIDAISDPSEGIFQWIKRHW